MKKVISILSFILLIGIVSASAQCCDGGSKTTGTSECSDKEKSECSDIPKTIQIKAYYFHAARRCATCKTVEKVSSEAIKEHYGNKVSFKSINIEEKADEQLIDTYKISGQTLLIVKGDKTVNLTNEAFLNARTNPEKLKSKIKSTIDSMM